MLNSKKSTLNSGNLWYEPSNTYKTALTLLPRQFHNLSHFETWDHNIPHAGRVGKQLRGDKNQNNPKDWYVGGSVTHM